MKKRNLLLAIILLVAMIPIQRVAAQDNSKKNKEKEQSIQESIDEQKKAMLDKQKANEEAAKAMDKYRDEQKKAMTDMRDAMEEAKKAYDDAMKNIWFNGMDSDKIRKLFRINQDFSKDRSFPLGEPFVITPGPDIYGHYLNFDSERTLWDFSKSIKESSFTREYTVDVEPTVNTVVMAVNGDCKSGDIHIKLTMPNGKTYTDLLIDGSGNLNWRKSFSISENENKDKAGAWKFEITSTKATGFFKISLQTF